MTRSWTLALLATQALAQNYGNMGICWDAFNSDVMEPQFRQLAPYFSSIRTFVAQAWYQNAADVAARAGVTVALGLWIQHGNYENEITNAIAGAKRNPGTVEVIYVGNEELLVGWDAPKLLGYINDAKKRVREAGLTNVKVGTVQIDRDFYAHPEVVEACDLIGVNIHPFFSGEPDSLANPFQSFANHFSWLRGAYGDKVRMTETGYPSGGGSNLGHDSGYSQAVDYFNKFQSWVQTEQTPTPYYFMLQDTKNKLGHGTDFEAYFGLLDDNGSWKYPMPTPVPESFSLFNAEGLALIVLNTNLYARRPTHSINERFIYDSNSQLIKSIGSNKCLDAYQTASGDFAVHTWACDRNNGNQKWTMQDNYIYHARHNMCLDIDGSSIKLWPCHDHNVNHNQWFTKSEALHLFTRQQKILGVQGSSVGVSDGQGLPNATHVFKYDTAQQLIQNSKTNECLDAYPVGNGNFQVHTYECSATNANQKWKIDTVTKRVFHLEHRQCLVLTGNGQTTLANCDANVNQWFDIERPGQCQTRENDINYEGEDIISVEAKSPADCCAPCQEHPACHAYSFSNGRCYLKKQRVIKGDGVWPGTTSGRVYKCNALQKGVDFSGSDIAQVPAKKADDCCAHCRLHVGCMAFTWAYDVCYLKSGVGASVKNANAISATVN